MNKIIIARYPKHDKELMALAASMSLIGEDVILWDKTHKPIFDMMIEQMPSYLIIHHKQIDRAVVEALDKYKGVKVILYGIHVPSILADVSLPTAMLVPANISPQILQNLDDSPVPLVPIKPAANLAQYNGGFYQHNMSSEIAYLSTRPIQEEGLPTRTYINDYMNKILPSSRYITKIAGPAKLISSLYIGSLDINNSMHFMKSTQILIDFDQETMYDAIANDVFCITNVEQDMVPFFTDGKHFLELIDEFLSAEKKRRNIIKKAKKSVLNQHTYFHILSDLGEIVGEEKWKIDSLEAIRRFAK